MREIKFPHDLRMMEENKNNNKIIKERMVCGE
jgi:hypothetical protein